MMYYSIQVVQHFASSVVFIQTRWIVFIFVKDRCVDDILSFLLVLVGLAAISPASAQTVQIYKQYKADGCAAADLIYHMGMEVNLTECEDPSQIFGISGLHGKKKCVDSSLTYDLFMDATCATALTTPTTTTPATTTTTATTTSGCGTMVAGKTWYMSSCATSPPSDLTAITKTAYTDAACTTGAVETNLYLGNGGCMDDSGYEGATWTEKSQKMTAGQNFVTETFATRDCSGTATSTVSQACGVCNSTSKEIWACPGADVGSASPVGRMAALAILTASVAFRL